MLIECDASGLVELVKVRLARPAVQYGRMSNLLWDEVKSCFDPDLMGALPDVNVSGASIEDWQAIVDLVVASDWSWQYSESGAAVDWLRR